MTDAVRRQKDRATLLLSKGRLPAALEELRRIIKAVPGELGVRQKIAEILARQGEVPAAVAEYAEVARRYAEQGLFFKATALCRVILTLDPKHEHTQQQLAQLYAARFEPKERGPVVRTVPAPGAPLEAGAIAQANVPPVPPPAVPESDFSVDIAAEDLVFEAEPPAPPRGTLPQIPFFSSLSPPEFLEVLTGAMQTRAVNAGEAIVTEGEPRDAMYAIAQGSVAVYRQTQKVAVMQDGDFFGEMALLSDAPRIATVRAETDVVVLEFPRERMDALRSRHPGVKIALEQFYRVRLLANLMRANPLLQPLTDEQRAALSAAFQSCTFKPKEIILEEGRPGVAVFLVLHGRCAVFHRDPSLGSYPDLVAGDAIGEISVTAQVPVSATVMAKEPVVALRVPADIFREIVLGNPDTRKQVLLLASQRMSRTAKQGLLAQAGDQRV
ncbi:MAG: cyclic nucleotide-binding domain-containing protein [Archangium sp.]|nr:cyclic nucleotide-binding domain-containing protein [Archangium sp.]MDP3573875.1 cyclic nucleotide-binding domain-containing protein [Archangium sp.]